MKQAVFVNGYGATDDPNDGNYGRYLGAVSKYIKERPNALFQVYLCGGYTNRTDLTEAGSMRMVWQRLGVPQNAEIVLIEDTLTARENLRSVSDIGNVPIIIFCEYSRRWTMMFLASRFFSRYIVKGISFDAKSLTLGHQVKQLLFKPTLEVLAFYIPVFDRLRLFFRRRHIEAARRQEI